MKLRERCLTAMTDAMVDEAPAIGVEPQPYTEQQEADYMEELYGKSTEEARE